tara:strand:+ start:360 stop:650 length:291 start_codon:yes stop_codon:yes gene_type:complete
VAENSNEDRELLEIEHRRYRIDADLKYSLARFGDYIAKREQYRSNISGLDALSFYLIQKHHWTPATVREMSIEDMRFALAEEMHGWTMPPEARLQV